MKKKIDWCGGNVFCRDADFTILSRAADSVRCDTDPGKKSPESDGDP